MRAKTYGNNIAEFCFRNISKVNKLCKQEGLCKIENQKAQAQNSKATDSLSRCAES